METQISIWEQQGKRDIAPIQKWHFRLRFWFVDRCFKYIKFRSFKFSEVGCNIWRTRINVKLTESDLLRFIQHILFEFKSINIPKIKPIYSNISDVTTLISEFNSIYEDQGIHETRCRSKIHTGTHNRRCVQNTTTGIMTHWIKQ